MFTRRLGEQKVPVQTGIEHQVLVEILFEEELRPYEALTRTLIWALFKSFRVQTILLIWQTVIIEPARHF